MSIPNSSGAMGNVLRLQGLKNVSGRRVMPGEELEEENEFNDVSGTSQPMPNFANFIPPEENQPQEELGGELNSQSYDVRSNTAIPEEQIQEEEDPYVSLGRNLLGAMKQQYQGEPKTIGQQPPIETAQVDMQEGLPPVTSSEQVQQEEMATTEQQLPQVTPEQPQEEVKEPGTYVQIGATKQLYEDLAENPELQSEIERIFDVNLTGDRLREVNDLESAVNAYLEKLNGVDVALDTRQQQLMNKVANRDLSPSEQISMAIALLAPAIVAGAIAGKEGFVGGLAHSGKNVSESIGAREKERKEAEELLPEIALERSKIGKEKLATTQQSEEMKRKIKESVPNHALKKIFEKDGMLLNGKLVLNTGNPLLPLKSSAIRSDKDFSNFREKTMPKLTEKVSVTEQGLHLLDNLTELVEMSEKGKEGFAREYIPFYDPVTKAFKAIVPASRDTFKDENGNEVKISELYETTLEQLSDMYSQALGGSGTKAAFKTYREHFKEMIPNPYNLTSLYKGKTKEGTVKAQINSVKDKFEQNIVTLLDSKGVETGPIKELFSKTEINTKQTESNRKKNRANEAIKQVLGK